MWIVKLALSKPYTFIVAAILILVLGFSSVATTPTDIFPNIDIPVVTVIWSYSGLPAKEMEQRVTTFSEFVMAVVNDVKSIDSQTTSGASVIKISFQPQVRIDAAMSQVGAAVNSIRFRMPPGVNPPWILRFSASTVPSSSSRSQATPSLSPRSTTTVSSAYASNSPPSPALSCPRPTAASPARSWSTSTRTPCSPKASRPSM